MIRRSASSILLLVPLLAGCELLAGIQERSYAPADGGAGGHTPLDGGPDGQPADWTPFLTAVYSFELPADLGHDTSGHEHHLSAVNQPGQSPDAKEGAHSLAIDKAVPSGLSGSYGELGQVGSTGLTFGAWVQPQVVDNGQSYLIGRTDSNNNGGYQLTFDSQYDRVQCTFIESPTSMASAEVEGWTLEIWQHLVCRYDAGTSHQGDIFRDGSPGYPAVLAELGHSGEFEIPMSITPATALIDEVFVAQQALSDESIRRIWACSVSGAGCTCNPDNPVAYDDCGGAKSACLGLPPCNQPAP